MYELDAKSLMLVSKDCLSICQDKDVFLEPLGPLIDKYRSLGGRLKELSLMIQESGRSQQYYQDQELIKHVHEAKTDLEKHCGSTATRGWLQACWTNRLKDDKIAKLHQQANDHIRVAQDFKIGFLLDTRHTRLEALVARLVAAGAVNSPRSAVDGLGDLPIDHIASATAKETGQSFSTHTQLENVKTTHLVDDFSGVIKLARVVWKGRADIAHQNRNRHKPGTGQDRAKSKFIEDVVSLIEEAKLYTADVDLRDNDPQQVLDRLIEIVSKALQLKHAVGSSAIQALDHNDSHAIGPTEAAPLPPPPKDDLTIEITTPSQPSRLQPYSIPQLPDVLGSGVKWDWSPEHEKFLSVNTSSIEEVSEDDHGSEKQHEGSRHLQTSTSLGSPEVDFFPEHDPSTVISSNAAGAGAGAGAPAGSYTSAQSTRRDQFGNWVKIFIPQIMLQPAFCFLETDETEGEVWIETTIVPRRESARSIGASDSLWTESSSLAPANNVDEREFPLAYTAKFSHLLGHPRSIPSVKHPNYEGPAINMEKPYTITFYDPQALGQEGVSDKPQEVGHLEYTFSHQEQRTAMLSFLFGKTFLASAGVIKIEFGSIVCLRETVILWYDDAAKCSTITFLQGLKDQRREAPKAVEYEIVGIEQCEQRPFSNAPVVLYVKPLFARTHKRQRCSIYFTEPSGRKTFADILQPP